MKSHGIFILRSPLPDNRNLNRNGVFFLAQRVKRWEFIYAYMIRTVGDDQKMSVWDTDRKQILFDTEHSLRHLGIVMLNVLINLRPG
jgi:hypothetical protein